MKNHKKPKTNEDLGYYLAGLIEGDGHIHKEKGISICFHINDSPLAYFIKKKNRLWYSQQNLMI